MLKKLWLSAFTEPGVNATFAWMVELDLSKTFKFVELPNNRIGFTQVDQKESNDNYKQSLIKWLEGEKKQKYELGDPAQEDGYNDAIDKVIKHIQEQ